MRHQKLPKELGWKGKDNSLGPVTINQPPASENLLKMIFFSCKTGCGSACDCGKVAYLNCSTACLHCCLNVLPLIFMNEMDNENIGDN